MSEFRSRLRTIREQAEEKASRLGSAMGSGQPEESKEAQRFREVSGAIADLHEELSKNFAEEFDGFESIRVAMEAGHCIRLSRLEDIEGTRKLSRLTFNLETLAVPGLTDVPRGLRVSCKGIVFNRERGQDEIEIDFGGSSAQPGDPIATARTFAERNLLDFASAYEQARMASLRPIS